MDFVYQHLDALKPNRGASFTGYNAARRCKPDADNHTALRMLALAVSSLKISHLICLRLGRAAVCRDYAMDFHIGEVNLNLPTSNGGRQRVLSP